MKKMQISKVELQMANGKNVSFAIEHNVGEALPQAVESWSFRTTKYTGKDFCRYLKSKGFECKVIVD